MSEENEKEMAENNEAVNQKPEQTLSEDKIALRFSIFPFLIIFAVLCVLHWTNVIRWSWLEVVLFSMFFSYFFGCSYAVYDYPKRKDLGNSFGGVAFWTPCILCILKWTGIISWSWWTIVFLPLLLAGAFVSFTGVLTVKNSPAVHPRVYCTALFGFFLPFCILKLAGIISWSWWWSIAIVLGGWLVAIWIVTAFQRREDLINTPICKVETLHLSDLDEFFGVPEKLEILKDIDDAHATICISALGELWRIHAEIECYSIDWINPKYNAMFFLADDIDEDLQKLLQNREYATIDLTSRYVERGN